jgi:hypothetical protein
VVRAAALGRVRSGAARRREARSRRSGIDRLAAVLATIPGDHQGSNLSASMPGVDDKAACN